MFLFSFLTRGFVVFEGFVRLKRVVTDAEIEILHQFAKDTHGLFWFAFSQNLSFVFIVLFCLFQLPLSCHCTSSSFSSLVMVFLSLSFIYIYIYIYIYFAVHFFAEESVRNFTDGGGDPFGICSFMISGRLQQLCGLVQGNPDQVCCDLVV